MTLEAAIYASGDGPATDQLAEAAFLLRTGWTWQQYQMAPDKMVIAMSLIINAEAELAKSKGGS